MLFYFHFLYSFLFNVISVATVLCFCGFHLPVVFTFPWFLPCVVTLWFAPSCHLHLPVATRGIPSVVCTFMVYTLPWFPPSCGLHLCMVPTLPVVTLWCPFHGLHFHGLHSVVVSTLPWFASSCGSHPPCGYSMVSLLWFAPSCGLHSAMVSTLWWLLHGVHPGFWLKLA